MPKLTWITYKVLPVKYAFLIVFCSFIKLTAFKICFNWSRHIQGLFVSSNFDKDMVTQIPTLMICMMCVYKSDIVVT